MNVNRKWNNVKYALLAIFVAAWISVPYFSYHASAGGVPILVRNANLASPTGSINPHGSATYELYVNDQRDLEVEVEDLSLPTGTSLTALVNGNNVGQLAVQLDGRARLKLRTQDGQTVPVVNDGDSVTVLNGSATVVAGVFGGGVPTPSPSASPTGSPGPTASPSPSGSPTGTPSPSPNPGNLFAALSGGTVNGVLPSGYAEFEIHSSRLELEVRVRQVALAVGSTTTVRVDGIDVGNMIIETGGEGRLRLRTDNGQTVPPVVAGSTIQILSGSTVILSGTFAGFTGPSPSPSPSGSPTSSPSPSPSLGRSFEAKLTGSGTAATGEFKVNLSADETQATIFGEFHGLSSDQTGARIETTTGTPVIIQSFGVVGTRNGNFSTVTIGVSAVLVQQLRTGLWSAIVTSANNPNGEISGTFSQRSNGSDFDGNGAADLAVFRTSNSTWYAQNESGYSVEQFGAATDRLVSGDFDGDGKTDRAVYKTDGANASWAIKRSSDGGITLESFGLAGDQPLRADFDGDGRSDLAVYRPSNSTWYFRTSGNFGFAFIQFGLAGDVPIPGDFDGDGKDDIAVFRGNSGTWYWLSSKNGSFNVNQFGLAGDTPVRGDFDGDGKNDVAVFRPSNATWYLVGSSAGNYKAFQFGLTGDVPVAADYDNDNITDIAVFRPSNSTWYSVRSLTQNFYVSTFGLAGDVPVIN